MSYFEISLLFITVILIFVSSFFSAAETSMMAINRYKLKYQAKRGVLAAQRVQQLLAHPDRLLGVILIGNTFANIAASSIVTLLVQQWLGDLGVVFGSIILTIIILIFGESAPKTLAAVKPQRIAYSVSLPLKFLQNLLSPIVYLITGTSNFVLKLLGVRPKGLEGSDLLTAEELHSLIKDLAVWIPSKQTNMLIELMELTRISVDDIMIPTQEIFGLDINSDWKTLLQQISDSQYTRLPIYDGEIDRLIGFLHIRNALKLQAQNIDPRTELPQYLEECYFVPEGTSLIKQLVNFQEQRKRLGFVVDEYGAIKGLITLDNILEEIVGEFTTDIADLEPELTIQADNTYLINGTINIRELNRQCKLDLPTTGPKTLSGLLIEYLETIPQNPLCLRINGYPIEIVSISGNKIDKVKIYPRDRQSDLKI